MKKQEILNKVASFFAVSSIRQMEPSELDLRHYSQADCEVNAEFNGALVVTVKYFDANTDRSDNKQATKTFILPPNGQVILTDKETVTANLAKVGVTPEFSDGDFVKYMEMEIKRASK